MRKIFLYGFSAGFMLISFAIHLSAYTNITLVCTAILIVSLNKLIPKIVTMDVVDEFEKKPVQALINIVTGFFTGLCITIPFWWLVWQKMVPAIFH